MIRPWMIVSLKGRQFSSGGRPCKVLNRRVRICKDGDFLGSLLTNKKPLLLCLRRSRTCVSALAFALALTHRVSGTNLFRGR